METAYFAPFLKSWTYCFLGHRDATITMALLAAFFSVTKKTAQPKPGGIEPTRKVVTRFRIGTLEFPINLVK